MSFVNYYENIAYCRLKRVELSSWAMRERGCIDPRKQGPKRCCKHFKKNAESPYWWRLGMEA